MDDVIDAVIKWEGLGQAQIPLTEAESKADNLEAVITTIIGLLGGFMLSALFWYVTVHMIGPSLEFSEQISRIADSTGATVYRVKIRNSNKRRGIIDVTFKVSIRLPMRAVDPLARSSSITSAEARTGQAASGQSQPGTRLQFRAARRTS